ncbi:MAG: transposase [Nitrosomonas sp. PRO4]|nr:transposase [Nitrosomonas sp. PRO4]
MEFLYDLTEELYCLDNGRAYIDPVLFFRMQLISYLFRIESDRQLCRDIHLDLAYRRNGQNIERTKLSILL